MCGIFGYWDRRRRALPVEALPAMARKLEHRGPDDEGTWNQPQRGVAIGNRRLSIIDIGGGHQPFVSDDGQVAVPFAARFFEKLVSARGGVTH